MRYTETLPEKILTNAICSKSGDCFLVYRIDSRITLERVEKPGYLDALDELSASSGQEKEVREVIGGFAIGDIVVLEIRGEKTGPTFQQITEEKYQQMLTELDNFREQLEGLPIHQAEDIDEVSKKMVARALKSISSSVGVSGVVLGSFLLSVCEELWENKRAVLTATVLAVALHAGYIHRYTLSDLHETVVAQIAAAERSLSAFSGNAGSVVLETRSGVEETTISYGMVVDGSQQELQNFLEAQAAAEQDVVVEVPVLRKKGGLRIEQETQSFSAVRLAKYSLQVAEVVEQRFTPKERQEMPNMETILAWALKESSLRENITGDAGEQGAFQVGDAAFADVARSLGTQKNGYNLMEFKDNLFIALKYYLLKHREIGRFLSKRGYEVGTHITPKDFEALIFGTYNRGAGHMMGLLEGYLDARERKDIFNWKDFSTYWLNKADSAKSSGSTYVVFPKTSVSGEERSPVKNDTMHIPTVYIMCQYPQYVQECARGLRQLSQVNTQVSRVAA